MITSCFNSQSQSLKRRNWHHQLQPISKVVKLISALYLLHMKHLWMHACNGNLAFILPYFYAPLHWTTLSLIPLLHETALHVFSIKKHSSTLLPEAISMRWFSLILPNEITVVYGLPLENYYESVSTYICSILNLSAMTFPKIKYCP